MRIAPIIAAAVLITTAACGADAEADDAAEYDRHADLSVRPGWAQALPGAAGTAEVEAAPEDGTGVALAVTGLAPDTDYAAHVHDAACDHDPAGGGHWKADPDGEETPANEIHLHLTTDADGAGSVETDNPLVADDRAVSIVVHAPEGVEPPDGAADDRVLCGDLAAR